MSCNGVFCAQSSCRIDYDMKIDSNTDDHLPISGLFCIPVCKSEVFCKRRIAKYDTRKFEDDSCVQEFKRLLDFFPGVPLHIDTASHCHVIDNYLKHALIVAFPLSDPRKKRNYITTTTFKTIIDSAKSRKLMFMQFNRFSKSILFVTFGIWSGCHWRAKWSYVYGFNGLLT